ncbi:MAG: hypothetical protein L3J02_05155 [Henriciella sp.]|nr:hypothetical protein [Henriciella sp.]
MIRHTGPGLVEAADALMDMIGGARPNSGVSSGALRHSGERGDGSR